MNDVIQNIDKSHSFLKHKSFYKGHSRRYFEEKKLCKQKHKQMDFGIGYLKVN